MLAGGMDNGAITLWNPTAMIKYRPPSLLDDLDSLPFRFHLDDADSLLSVVRKSRL